MVVPVIEVYSYRNPSLLSQFDTEAAKKSAYPNKLPASWTSPEGTLYEDMYSLTKDELAAINWVGPFNLPQGSFYDTDTSSWIELDYDPRFQYYNWYDDLGDNYGFEIEDYGGVWLQYDNFAYSLTETVEFVQLRDLALDDAGLSTRLTRFETDLNRVASGSGNWSKFFLDSYLKLYSYPAVTDQMRAVFDEKCLQFSIGALNNITFNPTASDLDGESQFTFSLYEGGPVEKKPTLTMAIDGKYSFVQDSATPSGKLIAFFTDSECTVKYKKTVSVVTNEVVGTTTTSIRIFAGDNYPKTLYYQSVDGTVKGGIINVVKF